MSFPSQVSRAWQELAGFSNRLPRDGSGLGAAGGLGADGRWRRETQARFGVGVPLLPCPWGGTGTVLQWSPSSMGSSPSMLWAAEPPARAGLGGTCLYCSILASAGRGLAEPGGGEAQVDLLRALKAWRGCAMGTWAHRRRGGGQWSSGLG